MKKVFAIVFYGACILLCAWAVTSIIEIMARSATVFGCSNWNLIGLLFR